MSRVALRGPTARADGALRAALPLALRRACSPYTGIVRSLEECLCPVTEPALFRVACAVGDGRDLVGSPLDHLRGIGGTGMSRVEAAAAAVGEALERYSASYVPCDRLVVASAAELGADAVDPRRFALFSERQYATPGFPYAPFTRDSCVRWVRGWSIRDRRPAWLPAELVHLGNAVAEGAPRIGHATSNGAACAEGTEDALVRALCELLERDAFMIVWSNRLSLPLIDVSRDERLGTLERELFVPTGLRSAAIDLSCLHGLPSVLAVVRAPAGVAGALGVGAGTAPTLERAWWKAHAEAFSARAAGAKLALLELGPNRHGEVASFEDHIRRYADHANAAAAAFLDQSPERVAAASIPRLEGEAPEEQVAALCERIEAAGSSGYAVDVTAPDVHALGLSVVKAVAPELCPLDVAHSTRHLGGSRLYDAPVALGLRREPLREPDLNPDPHPFP